MKILPSHFKRGIFKVEAGGVNGIIKTSTERDKLLEKTQIIIANEAIREIKDWIYENLNGRFFLREYDRPSDYFLTSFYIEIGFEDPKEFLWFTLHLLH